MLIMQAMPVARGSSSGTRQTTGRVLVVDDDPMVARSIALILSAYSVDIANSGAEALARIAEGWRYDVILCDVMMPSMTGPELFERLVDTAPAAAERVVFMTGCALLPEVRVFLERVASPCLEKPLDIDGLRALVEDRVRNSRTPASERLA